MPHHTNKPGIEYTTLDELGLKTWADVPQQTDPEPIEELPLDPYSQFIQGLLIDALKELDLA